MTGSRALPREQARLAGALHPYAQPSIAVVGADGQVLDATDPTRCSSLAATVRVVREFFRDRWDDGDAAVTNDPFSGGTRVTELTLVRGSGAHSIAVRASIPDIGGFHIGGLAPESFDIWGEGARFTPIRVQTGGRARREALDLLALNSRTPRLLRRCVHEMVRSAQRLERAWDDGLAADGTALAVAARRTLRQLRSGSYTAQALVECSLGQPCVRLTLSVAADRLELAFASSDAQVEAPLNSTPAHTADCALGAVVEALPSFPPLAAWIGALRIDAGAGTVTSATLPALTGLSPYLTARAIRRATTTALADAGASVADPDGWWTSAGEPAFAALVDRRTLRVRADVAAELLALEDAAQEDDT